MPKQKDYVVFGSSEHATRLGLRKAVKEDKFQAKGWTFSDITVIDPRGIARDDFIQTRLTQLVGELESKPEVPGNALPMWTPHQQPIE